MIPAQAVEAAEEYLSLLMADPNGDYTMEARDLLEAAAPHMLADVNADALRAAWDRGYATATDGMKDVPAAAWDEGRAMGIDECAGDIVGATNPYRPTP